MFYFFEKDRQFIRCEIREQNQRWEIVVTEPTGYERTERFSSSEAAHTRLKQLHEQFQRDGWFGPHSRD